MSDRNSGNSPEEHEQERVVVRDRRRIDPVTGEVRTPAGEQPAGAAPGHAPQEAPPDQTDARVAELAAQVEERTADLQRVSAEYANYRRRVDRDREVVLAAARAQFVGEMFTVLDDLDRAEAHGDLTGPFKSVADKIVAVVGKLGLESYGDVGELFDPALHEAVQHEESAVTGPSTPVVTVVSTVLRRGYRMADRVLRPAMVVVADRPAEPEPDGRDPNSPAHPDTT
ncbi:nucleotide exchange factor GrpE [Pseudonocardia sp.]|uniref:nucleotide exchange factor GrpE n=1 Tax=Pseudonocardia sp. TaxID=60912 RepID=UPI003D0E4D78